MTFPENDKGKKKKTTTKTVFVVNQKYNKEHVPLGKKISMSTTTTKATA